MTEKSTSVIIDKKLFQKMMFITNAVEQEWTVKKRNEKYIFKKKHENRKEYLDDKYLENFLITNLTPR